jgi:hypothetical protein
VPFELNVGPVKFLFHRSVDERALTKQIVELKVTVSSLPVGTFLAARKGQFENWDFWDNELSSWRMVEEAEFGLVA